MNILEIFLISLSVSIDAFFASIIKSISNNNKIIKNSIVVALWFGIFQIMMPMIGFFLGFNIRNIISSIGNIISFVILFYIGVNMIIKKENDIKGSMLMLAIATSLDAFSIGIVYFIQYGFNRYLITFLSMGLITFIMSMIGYYIGYKTKHLYKDNTKVICGIFFMILAFKILLT